MEIQITKHNLQQAFDEIVKELETEPVLLLKTETHKTGKWGMARLWRAWMSSTCEYMVKRGCKMPLVIKDDGENYGLRNVNAEDVHLLFTHRWMGIDRDGNRLSWARAGHDGMRAALKGERFIAMVRHEEWATERGIILFKPKDSEYVKLEEEQNKGG